MMVISKRLRSHDMWVKLFLKITYSHLYLPIYPSIETIIISGSKCASQLKTCEKILLDNNYSQYRYNFIKSNFMNLIIIQYWYHLYVLKHAIAIYSFLFSFNCYIVDKIDVVISWRLVRRKLVFIIFSLATLNSSQNMPKAKTENQTRNSSIYLIFPCWDT